MRLCSPGSDSLFRIQHIITASIESRQAHSDCREGLKLFEALFTTAFNVHDKLEKQKDRKDGK